MKKIFLMLILAITINAQDLTMEAPLDSGNAYTSVLTVPPNYNVKNFIFPALDSATTSYKIMAGSEANNIDTLWYDGLIYSQTISNVGISESVNFNIVAGWKYIMILFDRVQTSDRIVKVVLYRSY